MLSIKEIERLIGAGQLPAAAEACAALTRSSPTNVQVLSLAADIAFQSRRPLEGAAFLKRAIDSTPYEPGLLLRYGQSLLRLGKRQEALCVAEQAAALTLTHPGQLDALGTLFTHLEEPMRALPFCEGAVDGAPHQIDYRYNLAMVQRMMGALERAEDNLDIVIHARPLDGEAHHARSGLREQTRERNHLASLKIALSNLKGKRAALPVAFALAKELEDLGEYQESFAQLRSACTSYRASLQYDVSDDIAVLEKLRTAHSERALECRKTHFDNEECVFIVGLPRSGTTLVERILGGHSAMHSAGELDAFATVLMAAVASRENRPLSKLEFADVALNVDFDQLGPDYLQNTRPRTGHTAKFTDKRPLNYLYAGLIHAALPRARFIAVRRDPMDSCYAMYKTLFASEYPFTYDLSDLARYFVEWDRLMRHWERVIGDAWLTVRYEELIADPEVVSRRMTTHCGLAWEKQCLDFHLRVTGVTTASAVQIRRAINSDSIGKWRCYASELAPLASELNRLGISVG